MSAGRPGSCVVPHPGIATRRGSQPERRDRRPVLESKGAARAPWTSVGALPPLRFVVLPSSRWSCLVGFHSGVLRSLHSDGYYVPVPRRCPWRFLHSPLQIFLRSHRFPDSPAPGAQLAPGAPAGVAGLRRTQRTPSLWLSSCCWSHAARASRSCSGHRVAQPPPEFGCGTWDASAFFHARHQTAPDEWTRHPSCIQRRTATKLQPNSNAEDVTRWTERHEARRKRLQGRH